MFNAGTICNPSQTDIPPEAASDSLNIDPISEDGKLKGIPDNVKLEDNCGHEKNILLQNVIDPTKHDLISYKNSDNTIYKTEDIYSGSSTESSLGTIATATDANISMEPMEGAVYIGTGTAEDSRPHWIGRMDHGQWTEDPTNTLTLQEDTLEAPNTINETTSACSDGTHIYTVNGGAPGNYYGGADIKFRLGVGEITKIKVSDGSVVKRSSAGLGFIGGICLSWDQKDIWVIASDKWAVSYNSTVQSTNNHYIHRLDSNTLALIKTYTTNLDTLIKQSKTGDTDDVWESATASDDHWEEEDSYWEGPQVYNYQGCWSDIIELNDTLWVCTSAAGVFNVSDLGADADEFTFVDRTPLGLGYYYHLTNTSGEGAGGPAAYTAKYQPPGGMYNQIGGFYDNSGGYNSGEWQYPACHNASFVQLTGSNDWVGVYFKNAMTATSYFRYGTGSGDKEGINDRSIIVAVKEDAVGNQFIDDTNSKLYTFDDSPYHDGTREIANVMYKCPKDLYKHAYACCPIFTDANILTMIRKFDAPAYNGTSGVTTVTTSELETVNTYQIPIRIEDLLVVGMVTDSLLSHGYMDGGSETTATRNEMRQMSKWVDTVRTQFGPTFYLSQRCLYEGVFQQLSDEESDFHTEDKTYFYRYSFVFDGFQESPLGAAMSVISTGKKVQMKFVFNTDNFPTRITALRVYRATSISSVDRNIGGFYHFVGEIDITTQSSINFTQNSYPNGHIEAVNEGDALSTAIVRVAEIKDNGISGATYETMSGLFEEMTDSNVQYSLSTQLNNTLFIANCAHHSQSNATNFLYKSLPYKPSLINWALDFLKLPEVPVAITAFNGRIYVFGSSRTYKIEPTTFYIEDVFDGAGCLDSKALSVSDFGLCYCDKNNIYLNNGQAPIPIGDSILTSDAGIGYLDLLNTDTFIPSVAFDATRKSYIVFVTTTKAWSYNIVRKSWNLWEYDSVNQLKDLTYGKDGEILAALADNNIYQMFKSGTRKPWTWVSKRLSMRLKTQNKRWYEQIVSYEGTEPVIDVYWDNDVSTATISTGISESNVVRKQLGNTTTAINKRTIKTKLTGSADTEVDSIGFTFRRFIKLIDQGAPS